jgi:hypothetical protein
VRAAFDPPANTTISLSVTARALAKPIGSESTDHCVPSNTSTTCNARSASCVHTRARTHTHAHAQYRRAVEAASEQRDGADSGCRDARSLRVHHESCTSSHCHHHTHTHSNTENATVLPHQCRRRVEVSDVAHVRVDPILVAVRLALAACEQDLRTKCSHTCEACS